MARVPVNCFIGSFVMRRVTAIKAHFKFGQEFYWLRFNGFCIDLDGLVRDLSVEDIMLFFCLLLSFVILISRNHDDFLSKNIFMYLRLWILSSSHEISNVKNIAIS